MLITDCSSCVWISIHIWVSKFDMLILAQFSINYQLVVQKTHQWQLLWTTPAVRWRTFFYNSSNIHAKIIGVSISNDEERTHKSSYDWRKVNLFVQWTGIVSVSSQTGHNTTVNHLILSYLYVQSFLLN